MNTAIFFSGRIRGFQYLDTLRLIKEKYNPTFFCSLNEETITDEISLFFKTFNLSEDQYNIEKTIVPPIYFTLTKCPVTNVANTYSMFYHNKKCFELIERYPQKFDVIIKFRADIDAPMPLEISLVNPNTVYIPFSHYWESTDDYYGGTNDQIAYGDFNTMKLYCGAVDNILKFCYGYNTAMIGSLNKITNKDKIWFHPESINGKQIRYSNLSIVGFKYKFILSSKRYE
jgi:hypothetical protein